MNNLYIKEVPGKGRGVFSTKDIKAGEIALIKVNDILEALEKDGFLKLTTLKRKSQNNFRYVQIDLSDLNLIKNYINIYRKKIIRKMVGLDKDSGYLLMKIVVKKHLIV